MVFYSQNKWKPQVVWIHPHSVENSDKKERGPNRVALIYSSETEKQPGALKLNVNKMGQKF